MPIKLIVFSIDGALLDRRHRAHRINSEAIAAAREYGIEACIATGRSVCAAQRVSAELDIRAGLILCNGAVVMQGGEIISRSALPCGVLRPSLRMARQMGTAQFAFARGNIYMFTTGFAERDEAIARSFSPFAEECEALRILHDERDIEDVENLGVEKLMFTMPNGIAMPNGDITPNDGGIASVRLQFERALYRGELGDCAVTSSGSGNFELMARGVSKGSALLILANRLQIDPKEILAIGEEENDVEMLRVAGVPVAMGNAAPGAIASAKHITAPVAEGGLGKAIFRYALNYEIEK